MYCSHVHFQVHIKANFIMNGVCVRWRGWIDLERLDGVGCLEFNEERAAIEDNILREQIQRYNERLRDYEDKQRGYRQQDRSEQDLDVSKQYCYCLCVTYGNRHLPVGDDQEKAYSGNCDNRNR